MTRAGECYHLRDRVFGNLTVVRRAKRYEKHYRGVHWLCLCTCGRTVPVRADNLIAGRQKSCGRQAHLWIPDTLAAKHRSEYHTFVGMHSRCSNPKNRKAWRLYGGRGISVCERWRSFETFLEDMGLKPTPKHTLDRYPDNDGNYEPANCRWATRSEQARNKQNTLWVTCGKERILLVDLADRLGLRREYVRNKLPEGWFMADPIRERKL